MDKKTLQQTKSPDFTLMLGGPFYSFYLSTGLAKKPLLRYKRRVFAICMFAWLPLFILAMVNGTAFRHVVVPFITDIDVHVRFLVSLALLIYAEVIVEKRLKIIIDQFFKCNIIQPQDKRFYSTYFFNQSIRRSRLVEI